MVCALQKVDADLVVGGPGLAYWIQTDPAKFPNDQRVSGTYFAQMVSNSSLPLNFFSFHAIAACTDTSKCDIANVRLQATRQPPSPLSVADLAGRQKNMCYLLSRRQLEFRTTTSSSALSIMYSLSYIQAEVNLNLPITHGSLSRLKPFSYEFCLAD